MTETSGLFHFLRRKRRWRWSHGFDDWRWVDSIGCWFHPGAMYGWDYFALGDRMFHRAFGVTRDDIVWHGSYADNWHGGIQTRDFEEALAWLRDAKGRDVYAWSKG